MAQIAERADALSYEFDAFRRESGFGADGLRQVRDAAYRRFEAKGWPTTRDEEWSHTNVGPIAKVPFERAATAVINQRVLAPFLLENTAATVVVVNGRIDRELSILGALPPGVTIRALSEYPELAGRVSANVPETGVNAFVSLNTAFFPDLVAIDIDRHVTLDKPVHVLFVTVPGEKPTMASPRLSISADEQSRLSVVESYVDAHDGQAFTNAVTDVRVGPSAMVDHVKLQRHGRSFHLATMFVRTERAGTFTSHAITLGGRIARNDIISLLDGDGAECTLNGLYVATDDSLVDTHTTIDHAKPHCPSHEVYKGILSGHARAVFNGKILVRQDAQKTNAKQTNRALLLSDNAQVNTKPQLEIFADDVKCTHGAAIGQLDEDAMFYLRARGVGEHEARIMLIHAFAGQVLDGIRSDAVRAAAMHAVDRKLAIE